MALVLHNFSIGEGENLNPTSKTKYKLTYAAALINDEKINDENLEGETN
jgi:hypothetical protein